jgi:hypothetical protein
MKKYILIVTVLFLCLLVHFAYADSISLDNTSDGASVCGSGPLTYSYTTAGNNRLLVVDFFGNNTGLSSDVTGVTYAGVAMTLIGTVQDSSSGRWIYMYGLVNPAVGANNVVASFNSSNFCAHSQAVSYDGVNQSNFLDASTTNTAGSGTTFTTNLTTVASGTWATLVATNDYNGAIAAGAGSTLRQSDGPYLLGIFDTNGPLSIGSHSMSVTDGSSSNWASIMASFAPAPAATTSTPPQSLVATSGNAQVGLSWSAPSSNGGASLTQYLIYDRLTGGPTFSLYSTTSPSTTSTTVTSLSNSQSYDFEVVAQNSVGTSSPSNIASSTPMATVPGAPQSLTATASNTQASLSWSAPASNGGSGLTQYLVYDRTTGSPSFGLYATTSPSQTTSTVTSLTNNTSYDFEVLAQNGIGTSSPSNIATATPYTYNTATSTTSGGNWSATSTWTGGVVPGDNSFVTIQGPVVIDQNIGTVIGGGVKNITLTGSAANLSVNTSSPRVIRFGSYGANAEGSGGSSAPGYDANMFGFIVYQGTLSLVGTQADPVTLEAANGTSPIYIAKLYGPPYSTGSLYLKYADVYNLGSSLVESDCSGGFLVACFPGIYWDQNNATASTTIDIENSRFTSPYQVLSMSENPGPITFVNNYITGRSGSSTLSLFANGTGSETVTDNTEVSPAANGLFYYATYMPHNAVFLRNALSGSTSYFIGGFQMNENNLSSGSSSTIGNNLLYNYPNALSALTYSAFGDSDQNTLASVSVTTSTPYENIVDSNISEGAYKAINGAGVTVTNNFLTGSISLGQGQLFLNGSNNAGATAIKNNIVMYFPADPSTYGGQTLVLQYQGANNTLYDHNTFINAATSTGVGATGDAGISIGDKLSNPENSSTTIRSNLIFNTSYGIVDNDDGTNYTADFAGAGVHHNDVYQFGYGAYAMSTSSVNFFDGTHNHPSSVYGDVTLSPQFSDPSRISILNYDSSVLGGPGTAADVFTKLGYRSGWGGRNTLGANPINDMRTWLFAGFVPTNPSLASTAADGGTDGAVPFTADVTPPAVNLTVPASGAALSGSAVTITASSTDGGGVAGVTFYLDGSTKINSEVTVASSTNIYTTSWNSTSTADGLHTLIAVARDLSNNYATSSAVSFNLENSAPIISAISSGSPGQTSAVITWTTNNPASSQVAYGSTSGYGATTSLDSTLVTSHSVSLSGLSAGAPYHFQVLSVDSLSHQASSTDQTLTTQSVSSGGGGGGGGGGGDCCAYSSPSPSPSPSPSQAQTPTTPALPAGGSLPFEPTPAIRLVNDNGTYYLIQNLQKLGITSPGILKSYGLDFQDAQTPTPADLALVSGPLLLPDNGSLVKSQQDQTVYLVSNGKRFAFTSANVFLLLGFKFSSVLTVTNPELQELPLAASISNSSAAHLRGVDINNKGTIYFIGGEGDLHPYTSLAVYNSWHLSNDFSGVVLANSADLQLPIGSAVVARQLQ